MRRPRVVAAGQTIPVPGDVARNTERHIELIHAAADTGSRGRRPPKVNVLVFPELSLTGYELGLAEELAFAENDARLKPLQELASRYGMTIVVGAPLRLEARLYIAAFILDPEGSVAVYTKHHLGAFPPSASVDGLVPPAEATVFSAGTENPEVRFNGHVAAVAVCADSNRATHAANAARRGAMTYLASNFVIPSEFEDATANLQGHAARHSMVVVFANYGGPSGGLASAGRSAIWSEKGELLAELDAVGSGVVIATESDEGWSGRAKMMINGS